MMRPPSVPGYEPLLDKLKQQTQALSGSANAASVTPGTAVGASTTPLGQATSATPLGIQVAAVAPFAAGTQPPSVGTPFAAPTTPAPPDSRMSPIAAFYNQFATLDPALQVSDSLATRVLLGNASTKVKGIDCGLLLYKVQMTGAAR